jgi:hypothetical protein
VRRYALFSRKRQTQRGQALIEFTFFVLIMLLLLVGVTDIAALLDDHESVVYAARQGARTGAVIGPAIGADCAIVGAVHASLVNLPRLQVRKIIIFRALPSGLPNGTNEQGYPGTADCQNGKIIDTATGLTITANPNGWPETGVQGDGTPDRNNTAFFEYSLGVELDYSYTWQFNLIGSGTFDASDAAVFPINPAGLPTPIPTNTVGA